MKWARSWKLFIIFTLFSNTFLLFSYLKSCILYFILFSWLEEICNLFPFMEDTFQTVSNMSARGISTLMFISDGLGPSVFCRKMEKARPMREEMDGKVVFLPPESAFLTLMLWYITYFSLFVPLTWRVNNYVSRQWDGINRRIESTKTEELLFFVVMMIIPSIINSLRCIFQNC